MHNNANNLVNILQQKGINNPQVLAAIKNIPRDYFVETNYQDLAYEDTALPISCGQTISQPFVVALMTQALLEAGPLHKVLEIGTGSGYQCAILSQVADEVYSIERIHSLYQQAIKKFAALKINNVQLRFADGNLGWEQHSLYDGIIVTAAAQEVPAALKQQLAEGGRLIIPVGGTMGQQLLRLTRQGDRYHSELLDWVVFVPLLKDVE